MAIVTVLVGPAYVMWLWYAPLRALEHWARAHDCQLLEIRRIFWKRWFLYVDEFRLKARRADGYIRQGDARVGHPLNPFSLVVTVKWDERLPAQPPAVEQ